MVRCERRLRPVSHHHQRPSRERAPQPGTDPFLQRGLQPVRRLVQDQQVGVPKHRPGDAKALPLAAREVQPLLADPALEPLRQCLDEAERAGQLGGGAHLRVSRLGP